MVPGSDVSGLYFNHPDSKHFAVGKLARDQVEDYARRQGTPVEESERWFARTWVTKPEQRALPR